MIIVVDMNILFSGIISPNGAIAKIISDTSLPIEKISCHYSFIEIFKHQPKIVKYSKKSLEEVVKDLYTIYSSLTLYNENMIAPEHWQEAKRLTDDVDCFDINYVALALHTGGWLWTGDKPLTRNLRNLGFERVLNTAELLSKLGEHI